MRWLDDCRIRLMLLGFVFGLVLVGSRTVKADFTFGSPTNFATLADSGTIWGGGISPDELSLYFSSERSGGYGGWDIWVLTRATTSDAWDPPVNLGPTVNTAYSDILSSISRDGLSLYICDHQNPKPGGYGSDDLWVATRETTDDDWGAPVNLGPTINSAYAEVSCAISPDGLSLYLQSNRPGTLGGCDIWVTTRETTDGDWPEPVNLGPTVNSSSSSWDGAGIISSGGLVMFFDSKRPGGYGGYDVWVTTRPTTSDPWSPPFNAGPVINTSANDWWPSISHDGSTLYFLRGGSGMWQAPILPVVDFNGDENVDSADICIMVDHWEENYSYCDIGPTPLGDGVVDTQDLIALSEYFFEDINDPTLISHWALDEAQGDIAYNSVVDCDGSLMGNPIWQPDGGIVAGALQFDGIDDCVRTGSVLNSADGVFSVIAWVQGGSPGQVVISQEGGADWLMTDAEGNLMTGLRSPGRTGSLMISQTNITDGNWHRIGFVWDGSNRMLYVDDIMVAQDTQDDLEGLDNGLYIGTGKAMEAGTYWSGLIDDVRIYNREVIP